MKLFEPLDINGMVLPNRIMIPAMVTRMAGEDGFVNEDIINRYVRYAEGGSGLIVVEAMAVHHSKAGQLLRISDDKFIPGLAEIARRVHDTSDSKILPQILHFLKVSLSGWRQTVDMLSLEDIDLIVEQFGHSVRRAREAGFDGAEIHGAHAYTVASFLSRRNARKEDPYEGQSLEGRLHLIGRIMESVRREVGRDFPVGVRINADEFIRGGYTICDSKLIALRLAQLGFDYLSLSAGGKFEDAEHSPGMVFFPYTGFSGDRCMSPAWYPPAPNAHLAAEIKAFLNANGFNMPVAGAGKLDDPDVAESMLTQGKMDFVGLARGLLADPDWPKKVRRGELDRLIKCDYCNVCKHFAGTHNKVNCFLWPKGAIQAPADQPGADAPSWGDDKGGLRVAIANGSAVLAWKKAPGAARYDVYRAADDGQVHVEDAVKVTRWVDGGILAGRRYRYYVRACSATGQTSVPSNSVVIEPQLPAAVLMAQSVHSAA